MLGFLGILLNCNNTKSKEPEYLRGISNLENVEIFNLINPINKLEEPFYNTFYDGYSISLKSNSIQQELIFQKGDLGISKVLSFYYENPETVFFLFKSNLDNFVILIEGRDYYGSNLGIYYIDNTLKKIIEIDDTLNYFQDDPESKGLKLPAAAIKKENNVLNCRIYIGNKLLIDKNYDLKAISNTNLNHEIEDSKNFQKTTISDLKGIWGVNCANELTVLDVNGNKGFLSLNSENAIYINLKV